ncbi:hypothetical protein DPEC_G00205680 [Dallia pectoralis]|uniref:Uncharacterized protein n=1 Tax=Dallia pectoralis TaxID=75939 RepID=A0ACC2G4L4_DALPE|nr:hypothetical protein DPEC_G00205680 [Dallia pectoralis]
MTAKETVWRILSQLLSNALAIKINWRGANGKQAFEPLALKYIVLNAVRRNPLTSNASDTDIEKYIKGFELTHQTSNYSSIFFPHL